ncbi:hypothetical protein [Phytohabitans aurantiacus]|nr:hypothetical protein [Phytohabitans aurantiacus]
MDMVSRLWNGKWGRARLDIWVDRDGDQWHVTARIGGPEGDVIPYGAGGEGAEDAVAYMVDRLKATAPGDQEWQDITDTYRRPDR